MPAGHPLAIIHPNQARPQGILAGAGAKNSRASMPRLNMRGAKGLANCGVIRPARPASSSANQGRGQYKSMALQLPRWPQLPYTAREPQTRSTLERPPPHLARFIGQQLEPSTTTESGAPASAWTAQTQLVRAHAEHDNFAQSCAPARKMQVQAPPPRQSYMSRQANDAVDGALARARSRSSCTSRGARVASARQQLRHEALLTSAAAARVPISSSGGRGGEPAGGAFLLLPEHPGISAASAAKMCAKMRHLKPRRPRAPALHERSTYIRREAERAGARAEAEAGGAPGVGTRAASMHCALSAPSRDQCDAQRPVPRVAPARAAATASASEAGILTTLTENISSPASETNRSPPPSRPQDECQRDCVGVPIFSRADDSKSVAGAVDRRPADIEVEFLTPVPVPSSPMCGWDVSAHCFSPGLQSPCMKTRHAPTPPPPAAVIADEIYEASKQRKHEARARKQARAEARAEARRARVQEIMASACKEKQEKEVQQAAEESTQSSTSNNLAAVNCEATVPLALKTGGGNTDVPEIQSVTDDVKPTLPPHPPSSTRGSHVVCTPGSTVLVHQDSSSTKSGPKLPTRIIADTGATTSKADDCSICVHGGMVPMSAADPIGTSHRGKTGSPEVQPVIIANIGGNGLSVPDAAPIHSNLSSSGSVAKLGGAIAPSRVQLGLKMR